VALVLLPPEVRAADMSLPTAENLTFACEFELASNGMKFIPNLTKMSPGFSSLNLWADTVSPECVHCVE
jgi:hypothetical protein